MKLRYRFANQVVGAFIILAVAITVALVVLMGANQRWFRRNYEYYAILPDARDVTAGMAVTFRGFTIGRVTDVTLNENNEVDLQFYIHEEYLEQVRRNSLIQIVSNPLGGGEIIFHQGREPTPPMPEGSQISTYDSKQGVRLRADNEVIVLRTADPVAQILDQVDPILANLDQVLENINVVLRDDGEVIAEDVAAITSNLRETTEAFRDPTGIVPRLIDPQGSIATLLDDDNELYDQLNAIIASLDQSVTSLSATLEEVAGFADYLNESQPQISSLLEEGRQTLDSGQDVLEGLRNNPLLRGGIPEEVEQPTTFEGIRDSEF